MDIAHFFGILIWFGVYFFFSALTEAKYTMGCIILAFILSLGVSLLLL